MPYDDNQRERARITFAARRLAGGSIEDACRDAEISTSTFYDWNRDDAWTRDGGWSRDEIWLGVRTSSRGSRPGSRPANGLLRRRRARTYA
jgi:hypothetical protein